MIKKLHLLCLKTNKKTALSFKIVIATVKCLLVFIFLFFALSTVLAQYVNFWIEKMINTVLES